ncbi:MAG TPA: hypothetical protein VEZ89_09260, partial [Rubrivivax sp.]|nr:hypothetical protein [Rubrivivax sp.]
MAVPEASEYCTKHQYPAQGGLLLSSSPLLPLPRPLPATRLPRQRKTCRNRSDDAQPEAHDAGL